MEHLSGTDNVPIRALSIRYAGDEEEENMRPCIELFKGIVVDWTTEGKDHATEDDLQYWMDYVSKGGKELYLCGQIQLRFFFVQLQIMFGDSYRQNDFLVPDEAGRTCLSTSQLEEHLQAWATRYRSLTETEQQDVRYEMERQLTVSAIVLQSLSGVLDANYRKLCAHLAAGDFRKGLAHHDLGKTHLVCVLLYMALVSAYEKTTGRHWQRTALYRLEDSMPWLETTMKVEAWCPYTIRLFKAGGPVVMAYAYALKACRLDVVHANCDETKCVAGNVQDEIATAKHVPSLQGCSCAELSVPHQELIAILRRGERPVVKAVYSVDNHLTIMLEPATDSTRYVAISHVWADGLGSPSANVIRVCQLQRLQTYLEVIQHSLGSSCPELHFWMDTLCIPVEKEYRDLRLEQVNHMNKIYKEATAVLVCDEGMIVMRKESSWLELNVRLQGSIWASRLWTFQEGSVGRKLFVAASDGIVDIDSRAREILYNEHALDPLYHRTNGSLLQITGRKIRLNKADLDASGFLERLEDSTTPIAFEDARPLAQEEMDQIYQEVAAQRMLASISDRTCTQPSDEALIIASSQGLDVMSISQALPEGKMVALMRAFQYVPANVIFTLAPRLHHKGFRWAPTTFLASRDGSHGRVSELIPDHIPHNTHAGDFKDLRLRVRPLSTLDPEGRGLRTFNAGILITAENCKPCEPHREHFHFSFEGRPFMCHPVEDAQSSQNLPASIFGAARVENVLNSDGKLVILVPYFHRKFGFTSLPGALVRFSSIAKDLSKETTQIVSFVCSTVVLQPTYESMHIHCEHRKQDASPNAEWLSPRWWLID